MQRDAWTPSYHWEVTNEIFALYIMEKACGNPFWTEESLTKNWQKVKEYIRDDKPWPGGANLYFYMELVHHFGWEAMKGVYRAYEELISNGLKHEDDEEKEDRFYEVFSRQVERDLIPFYDFWNNRISEESRSKIQSEGFNYFLPDDEITELNPDKLERIRLKYGISELSQVSE